MGATLALHSPGGAGGQSSGTPAQHSSSSSGGGLASASYRGTGSIAAVMADRSGGNDFRFFPHRIGTARCTIPFAVTRGVQGTCSTRVSLRRGNGGQILVTFYERWPWRAFHYSGTPQRRPLHHRWVFGFLGGKVTLVGQRGDFAPNFAY
jgi:hypothetical protein